MSDEVKRDERAYNRKSKKRSILNRNCCIPSNMDDLIKKCQQNLEYDLDPSLDSDI